ncbi:hypothetical protein [Melioribacter sp. OK-6-Me]|uniref:hypothetical protein n=1 Tax=unclassified Melioribacter TaxID=2627329 RepID=UPI003EDB0562
MNYKHLTKEYSKNFKIALSISLLITIIIFISVPSFKKKKTAVIFTDNSIINLISIPHTVQWKDVSLFRPAKVNLSVGIINEELELLEDIEMSQYDNAANEKRDEKTSNYNPYNVSPIQISEIVPSDNIKVEGRLMLKLWIDYKGKPIKTEIISSTLSPSEVTKDLIEMAMRSEWLIQNPVPDSLYIVYKEYNFN